MDWSTLALCIATAAIVAFIIGGCRVSLRAGMRGRALLANVGLSKQERSAQRDRFWAEVFGPGGGLDRWLIFGGAACSAAALLALGALAS